MGTRIFTPEELDAIGVPFETYDEPVEGFATELHRKQISSNRWTGVHELIFRAPDDGNAYRVTYEEGLTEYQEADLWFSNNEVKAEEVELRPITVQRWFPVDKDLA